MILFMVYKKYYYCFFQVILAKIALDNKTLKNLHHKYQKSQNFQLNNNLKHTLKFAIYLECIIWCFSIILAILFKTTKFAYSKAVYSENWPFLLQNSYKTLFSAFVVCGYCLGNAHQSDYLYAVLHNYCQMNILIVFLKKGLEKYKKTPWKEKNCSKNYQKTVQKLLITTFQRYHRIKSYVKKNDEKIIVKFLYFQRWM